MDSFKVQKVKARKTKGKAKKSKFQTLSNLFFRAIEITVVTVTVVKLVYQLVITFENTEEHFKGLGAILANRHFVFFVGNVILITVLAKSGHFPNREPDAQSSSNGVYEEFVRESRRAEATAIEEQTKKEDTTVITTKQSTSGGGQKQKEDVTENREKQSMAEKESSTMETMGRERQSRIGNRMRQRTGENREEQSSSYVRSRSENFESSKSSCGRLRRSETVRSAKIDPEETTGYEMSNDELRYKIESFIARQRRKQNDEEFCII